MATLVRSKLSSPFCYSGSRYFGSNESLREDSSLQKEISAHLKNYAIQIYVMQRLSARRLDENLKSPQKVIKTEDKKNVSRLKTLARNYAFDTQVKNYLFQKPFLFDVLFDAAEEIHKYFGDTTKCYLDILRDTDHFSEKLFVEIYTTLDPTDAFNTLNIFDQNWWFNVSNEIHKHLEFSLEFE